MFEMCNFIVRLRMVLGVIILTAMVFKGYEVTINIISNLQYGWNCFFKLKIKGHAILK